MASMSRRTAPSVRSAQNGLAERSGDMIARQAGKGAKALNHPISRRSSRSTEGVLRLRVTSGDTSRIGRRIRGLLRECLACLVVFVAGLPLAAQENGVATSGAVAEEVSGSKLLTPSSFGFDIPVAHVEPAGLGTVETGTDGQSVVAKVHAKIGEHFIVMLPDGQLVARSAAEVARSEESFHPGRPDETGRALLRGDLARFSNMKITRTRHYIFLYNTSEPFLQVTKRILESMLEGVESWSRNLGIPVSDPPVPLVVIMFRSEAEFQAFRPMPPGILAYYNMVSNRVILHEESSLAASRPDLARGQLLSTIAHEGAHQILHNIGVQQRLSLWPLWLSEGLAEFMAPTSFGRNNRWKGVGVINDLRMLELETYLQTQYIAGFNGTTISSAVTASQLDSTGYATAWSIVHFLANKRKAEFEELVRRMSRLGPMRGMAARPGEPVIENLEHFQELFGENPGELETEMVDYLSRLDYSSPVADQVHYVGLLSIPVDAGEKRLACFFHTRQGVETWRNNLRGTYNEEQLRDAAWTIEEFSNRGAANQAIRRFLK